MYHDIFVPQISDSGLFVDAECDEEHEESDCISLNYQKQSEEDVPQIIQSPNLGTCVPLDVVLPPRKRKSESETNVPCKKLNAEDNKNNA